MCADNMYPHNQQSDPHTLVSDSQKTQNNIHNFSGNDNQEHQSSLLGKSSEINENAYNSLSHTQPTGEASTGSLSSTKNNANALLSNLSSKQPAPILTPVISMNGLVTSLPSTVENSDGDKINQSQTMIPQQLPMPSHQPIIPYQQQPHQAYVGNLQQQKLLQNDINSSLINNSGDNSRITASNINTDTTQINNSTALTSSTSAVPTIKMTMPTTKGKYSLNDFHLVQTLGTGSFGRVHLVCSVHNGRYYAMKVFRKSHVVKAKQIEHTNDERRILSMCRHPFITRMWGTFQDCKSIFIIMDYIEGGELFSLLRKSKVFPNQVAKFYAAEVLLALQYLHLKNIIYRDLKPENILISRSGHIKLADFGFAKQVETTTYTLCGTPDYIAPEIIAVQPYTKAVDYWSFGILIYEMIAGTTPFYDPSPMKTYENITKCEVVYPNHFQMDVINLLQGLITKDVTYRLGNLKNGIEDIKNHPWFDEVIWQNLLQGNIETPYEPNIPPGVGDTSQFEKYPEDRYDYGITGVPDEYGYLFPDF